MGDWLETYGSRRIVHCFGDSHVLVFRELNRRSLLPSWVFDVVEVPGATALGMVNPNSQTHALQRFTDVIKGLPKTRTLLFCLGEVDCGFVIWYQAEKKALPVETQLQRSFENYTAFLTQLLGDGRRHIVIAAVPPPTIRDGQIWGEVANLRREVKASLADRTFLTKRYNELLRRWAADHHCRFLDYEADVIDPNSRLVREDLRDPDPLNHHLARAPFSEILAQHLLVAVNDG